MKFRILLLCAVATVSLPAAAADHPVFDLIIAHGHIVDGAGGPWYAADIGIKGDRIAAIGDLSNAKAKTTIDATGRIVSPGFIDMLDQSGLALLVDNRSLSKLSQGITSVITGEGSSVAPQSEKTQPARKIKLSSPVDWTTLDSYFKRLEKTGTPLNFGTYVGAAQLREAVIGDDERAPTSAELEKMKELAAQAMKDGAMGLSTALIYPPGSFAATEELIALAKVVGHYGGLYATHMRSQGASEMAAVDEAIRIGREGGVPVEIFHIKVIGKPRWGTMPHVIAKIETARAEGLDVRADMYPYTSSGTALSATMPPWLSDGGRAKMVERLHDPAIRARLKQEMAADHEDWENQYIGAGGGTGILLANIANADFKKYEGKTVAQMAAAEGKSEMDAIFDLVIADKGMTSAIYSSMSEDDLRVAMQQNFVSIGTDATESSLDGPLYEPHGHPRSWGTVPRFLGHYVRDAHIISMEEAIRRMTAMPAQREHLTDRGLIKPGFYADITVFDPVGITDRATFENPAQASEGIDYVLVNGRLEYEKGKLTGVTAGKVLRGPGWQKGAQ